MNRENSIYGSFIIIIRDFWYLATLYPPVQPWHGRRLMYFKVVIVFICTELILCFLDYPTWPQWWTYDSLGHSDFPSHVGRAQLLGSSVLRRPQSLEQNMAMVEPMETVGLRGWRHHGRDVGVSTREIARVLTSLKHWKLWGLVPLSLWLACLLYFVFQRALIELLLLRTKAV